MALNVLVFVGKSLYQRCLTTDEVCHELKLRNIDLSPSEIEYLGRKFILGQLRKTLQKHAATTRLGEIIRDLHRRIANNALDAGT